MIESRRIGDVGIWDWRNSCTRRRGIHYRRWACLLSGKMRWILCRVSMEENSRWHPRACDFAPATETRSFAAAACRRGTESVRQLTWPLCHPLPTAWASGPPTLSLVGSTTLAAVLLYAPGPVTVAGTAPPQRTYSATMSRPSSHAATCADADVLRLRCQPRLTPFQPRNNSGRRRLSSGPNFRQ